MIAQAPSLTPTTAVTPLAASTLRTGETWGMAQSGSTVVVQSSVSKPLAFVARTTQL